MSIQIKKILVSFLSVLLLTPICTQAKSQKDLSKPFGFCTRSSRTDASDSYAYSITGGGTYLYPIPQGVTSVVTLKSTGNDMRTAISNALKNYSVIIFDGSQGDFFVSKSVDLNSLSNKTIIGINNARICTQWYVTDEIRAALDEAGVPNMSTSSGGGTLSNGTAVTEEAEYNTRQIIINLTGDTKETYRNAGIFNIKGCSNIIIRNLQLVGPGSIDVGGYDLISLTSSGNHIWVDHCDFMDGEDGNFDITNSSDFITVTWCTFSYTSRSYMHQNTNLIGSSDSEATGYLNITFANNLWGTGCRARMPMGRVGKIHMLNNYYTCTGNGTACINPRKNSEFLIEGNYFDNSITKIFSQSSATAYVWTSTNVARSSVSSKGSVTVPYAYTEYSASDVPAEVGTYAGATLETAYDWGYQLGDANIDGLITMADANMVVNSFLSGSEDGLEKSTADVNFDGSLTMADANAIVNLFLNGSE